MLYRKIINIIILLVCCLSTNKSLANIQIGDAFPETPYFDKADVLDITNKIILVDFWASWCTPCKHSFPVLNELQTKYKDQGFIILGVSVDKSLEAMNSFLTKMPAKFPVAWDKNHKLAEKLNLPGMPTSYLLDHHGTVRFIHKGFYKNKTEAKLIKEIEQLLKEKE